MTNDTSVAADVTLLQGLEPAMSSEEQAQLTAMMTSGDANELAKAAKIIYEIGKLLEKGILPNQRSQEISLQLEESFRQVAPRQRSKTGKNPPAFNNRELRVAEEKKENDQERQIRGHALPLPVRMPRYLKIEAYDPDGTPTERKKILGVVGRGGTKTVSPSAVLINDSWDGALGAAFTKINVQPKKKVPSLGNKKQQQPEAETVGGFTVQKELKPSPGFDEIVFRAGGYETRLIDGEELSRAIVAVARNDAAKLGLHRGDVITHINGEEVVGTAEEMNLLIKAHYATGAEQLELVVNAEHCIAQALKLRAFG